MLSDRCLSCLSVCLSVTLVYCGQTVGWIEMKLGMVVDPGHIVLDGDPAPPKKGHSPPVFSSCPLWPNGGWIKMPLGMVLGLRPGNFVLDGDAAPPKKGHIRQF